VTEITEKQPVSVDFPIVRKTPQAEFIVDITTDPTLLDQVYDLRYRVFNLELDEGLATSRETQRDRDEYDAHCEHLVVIDKSTNCVVGTYRMMRAEKARNNIGFYAETEFNLSKIYAQLPNAAEIGRCCIDAGYRSGLVMNMLWYGLGLYMEKYNISHLFGCTSLNKGDTGEQASLIYQVCKETGALVSDDIHITPQPGYEVKHFENTIVLPTISGNPKRLLPSLLRGYIAIGTKLGGEPAYDPEFDVIDFFTIFEYKAISKAAKRFLPSQRPD
jgi:L-ornithine Nalpha-acyltransferase